MEEKSINNIWELEEEVDALRQLIKDNKRHEYQLLSRTLFRGQANSNWELETTLERYTKKPYSVTEYNTTLWAVAPATSSFTNKEWAVERDYTPEKDFFSRPPSYEFMSYVRHHGFPSPLLDWSQSLYVALFFAYQSANEADSIAIYCYIESLSSGKSGWVGSPQICELGPYVNTHKRHFSQQGQYTVAVKKQKDSWVYCTHKEAFDASKGKKQDLLYKFVMPGSIKYEVLSKLHEMNINAFTLYSSEESLMNMLAYKEITMKHL